MARQTTERIKTDSAQGEGSYVVVRRPTRGQVKEVQRYGQRIIRDVQRAQQAAEAAQAAGDQAALDAAIEAAQKAGRENREATDQLIIKSVVEWNWVDEENTLLPLPRTSADLDALTDAEAEVLERAVLRFYAPTQDEAEEQEKN